MIEGRKPKATGIPGTDCLKLEKRGRVGLYCIIETDTSLYAY
uniref:Uncharacterized protein n=1 Tax=Anguilla anguilla TaxID=7936 RepID=A0A0E9PVQ4_ANGAN